MRLFPSDLTLSKREQEPVEAGDDCGDVMNLSSLININKDGETGLRLSNNLGDFVGEMAGSGDAYDFLGDLLGCVGNGVGKFLGDLGEEVY